MFDDLLQKAGEKRQRPAQHKVENNSKTENIHGLIKIFTVDNLRSDEPWSACILFLGVHAFEGIFIDSEPEVDDFDFLNKRFGFFFTHNDHDIFRFEIAMNEPDFFKILNHIDELFHDQGGFVLFQKSVAFHVLKQVTLSQIFCDYVQMGPGVKNLVEFEDVGVVA